MRPAVVIGANGQDGSYLAEHLIDRGSLVVGIGRQPTSRYVPESDVYRYRQLDLAAGSDALRTLLRETAPHSIYHLAAVHGSSGFGYEPLGRDLVRVNIESAQVVLEYIRQESPDTRLLYASSLKVFGVDPPPRVHEGLPRLSTCLYSVSKNAAQDLISYYRARHGVRATVVYYFNHDSPRRPPEFFLPRVTAALAGALRGVTDRVELRTLDFWCDWGSSLEFMQLSAQLLACHRNEDYIMASGKTWRGSDLVATLFEYAGLEWNRYVRVQSGTDNISPPYFEADLSRVKGAIGEIPRQSAIDIVRWILSEKYRVKLPALQASDTK